MDKEEFESQAERFVEAEKKFVATVYLMAELVETVNDRLGDFTKYLTSWRDLFGSMRDLMEEQVDMCKQLLESQKAIVSAFAETNVTISENSERLDKLIGKVEGYFGSGEGLEYDN